MYLIALTYFWIHGNHSEGWVFSYDLLLNPWWSQWRLSVFSWLTSESMVITVKAECFLLTYFWIHGDHSEGWVFSLDLLLNPWWSQWRLSVFSWLTSKSMVITVKAECFLLTYFWIHGDHSEGWVFSLDLLLNPWWSTVKAECFLLTYLWIHGDQQWKLSVFSWLTSESMVINSEGWVFSLDLLLNPWWSTVKAECFLLIYKLNAKSYNKHLTG